MPVVCSLPVPLIKPGLDQLSVELHLSVTGLSVTDMHRLSTGKGVRDRFTRVNDHPEGYWHLGQENLFL